MSERREAGIPRSSERGPSGPAAKPPRAENMTEQLSALYFTADAEANRLLAADPFALMLGMLLDQQVTMEWAFGAPLLLMRRLGVDHFDAAAIAAMDPAEPDAV